MFFSGMKRIFLTIQDIIYEVAATGNEAKAKKRQNSTFYFIRLKNVFGEKQTRKDQHIFYPLFGPKGNEQVV